MKIRLLNSQSKAETAVVADRMKKTLIDVLGEEKGAEYYSEEWLLDRVKYHVNLKEKAAIFLSEADNEDISGQAIVRLEKDENDENYGFFSTIYVADDYRKKGVAKKLISSVLDWCNQRDLHKVTYNTAEGHTSIISLFSKFGFVETLREDNMVKLELSLKK